MLKLTSSLECDLVSIDTTGNSGWYSGEIINKRPSHGQLCALRYDNGEEMMINTYKEATFRGCIEAHHLKSWKPAVKKLQPALQYLDSRVTNTCEAAYHMGSHY